MTRLHDMGGRFGDGPVVPEPEDAPVFAKPWHGRALALVLAAGALGKWSIDGSRHARERLAPPDYATFFYYEKWLAALADQLVETGVVTARELSGDAPLPSPLAERRLDADRVAEVLATGSPTARDGAAPQFGPGDRVRTRLPARNRAVEGGHTRLPAYAAGHAGTVTARHGAHVLPDARAHGRGEAPEPLYTVAFAATDLWGGAARPGDEVRLALWESYLEAEG